MASKNQSNELPNDIQDDGYDNIAEERVNDINVKNPQKSNNTKNNGSFVQLKDIDDQSIPEYIEILENHRKMCEKNGNYVEAAMAHKKIAEFKTHYEQKRRENLKAKHLSERQQIEEAHLTEFNQFNEFWDKKMIEFNEQAQAIEEQMINKHQQEMAKFLEELENSLPLKPKDSTELLNLRKIQENLAKQKDYIEAHKIQQKCLSLEKSELDKWQQLRASKIKAQRELLETKQTNELNALRKRILTGQDEQRKARSIELERLLQKYQNAKKDLDTQHQLQGMRLGKPGKSAGSLFKVQGSKGFNLQDNDSQKPTSRLESARKTYDSNAPNALRKSAQSFNPKPNQGQSPSQAWLGLAMLGYTALEREGKGNRG